MKNISSSLTPDALLAYKTTKPTLLIDLNEVEKQYNSMKEGLPGVKIFYAMKSNPDSGILTKLKKCGSGFEIASVGELHRLEKAGVNLKKVIYSNPIKTNSQIQEAHKKGIHSFAYDSKEEVERLAQNAPGSRVYLRVSVSNRGSLIDLSSKFGAEEDEAIQLLKLARDRGLHPFGLAFHVGSQAENLSVWDSAIGVMLRIMDAAKREGLSIQVVNIGGGMPIQYSDASPGSDEVFSKIRKAIRKLPKDVEIWCEPGRFLVGTSGVLIVHVISRSIRAGDDWLFLDVGRFQAFVEMFESDDLVLPVISDADLQSKDYQTKQFTLTGPTCDAYDTIYKEIELPDSVSEGDRLYFLKAGAYTTVYGSAFNDFAVPVTVCIE